MRGARVRALLYPIAISLLLPAIARSDPGIDHLLPVQEIVWEEDEYGEAVRRILDTPRPYAIYVRIICLPSFGPEWMIRIYSPRAKTAKVALREASESIWYRQKEVEIKTKRRAVLASSEVAAAVHNVALRELHRVRYPERAPKGRRDDGVTYIVSAFEDRIGTMSGTMHSPLPGSTLGRLERIAILLRELVLADKEKRETIGAQIIQLSREK